MQTTKWNKIKSAYHLLRLSIRGDKEFDFTDGSIRKAAFLLAIPMILEMVMESIFAIVDIFFVSHLGAEAVAIVGLTEAVITLIYAVAIGLSMGATSMIARRIGEKNEAGAIVVGAQTQIVGIFVSLIIALVGLLFAPAILRFMGGEESLVANGVSYTTIMLTGSFTIIFLFLNNAIFRGAGDAAIAMKALWLANGINIILDPLFIYGIGPFPEMGVTGAAVATNIGRGIGVLYQLYYLTNGSSKIHINWQSLRIDWPVILRLIKVSAGGIMQFFIATASWVILVRIVANYGNIAVAGYTIAIRIVMFTILPAWGLSNAVATLVGQNLGAGKPERAERSVWALAKYNTLFLVAVALVFIVWAETLISWFSSDPEVIRMGGTCLRTIAYAYGFFAIGMVLTQAFNGAGDTQTPTKINFVTYWLLQIPLAYILSSWWQLGPFGVFLAVAIADAALALIAFSLFRKGKWKQQVV